MTKREDIMKENESPLVVCRLMSCLSFLLFSSPLILLFHVLSSFILLSCHTRQKEDSFPDDDDESRKENEKPGGHYVLFFSPFLFLRESSLLSPPSFLFLMCFSPVVLFLPLMRQGYTVYSVLDDILLSQS